MHQDLTVRARSRSLLLPGVAAGTLALSGALRLLASASAVGGAGWALHSATSSVKWHTANTAEDCGVEGNTFQTASMAAHSASRAGVGSSVRHNR
jgi:hypothetical protein